MRRPLHYLLLQPAPVTHKPQHSHESSGPQDHHPSFYLSIPAFIHLYTALHNPSLLLTTHSYVPLFLNYPPSLLPPFRHVHNTSSCPPTRYTHHFSSPCTLLEIRAQFPPQSDTLLFISPHLAIDPPPHPQHRQPSSLDLSLSSLSSPVNLPTPTREPVGYYVWHGGSVRRPTLREVVG